MENEADKLIRHARVLLNLGHSFLGTVEIETSEESEETESEVTDGEETEIREKEVQKKIKSSKQHNTEEEKGKFVKQHNDNIIIKQQKLEKKTNLGDFPLQLNRDIQQKSYKTLPVKVGTKKNNLEKEVGNKSSDKKHELNIDLPNKLECGVDIIGEVQEELNKKLHTDDQPKIDKVKEHEADEELIKDSEKEKNEIQIQLLIEVPPMPGEEVELYLDVQVGSECQQELDIKKQEALGEKQQNIGKEHKNILVRNINLIDHKDIQVVNKNVEIKFDKVNISQDNGGDIQDKIIKGSKKNMEEECIQPELNENSQFGNYVKHNIKESQQDDDEETQINIHKETMDENYKRILQEIESLICDLKNRKKMENKKKKHKVNEEEECDELTAIRIAKITKEIEELEIDMEQKYDEDLEREYNEEFNQMFSSIIKEKFLEKLLLSFQEDAAPYYKRIENLLNNYFPTKLDTIKGKILIDPIRSECNEDVIKKADDGNDSIEELPEESDKITEKVEQGSDIYFFEVVPEESDIEMENLENEVVQAVPDIVNEDGTQEESDVDVEGLSNSDNEVTGGLDWNLQIESKINVDESDGQSLQESEEEVEELNEDVNMVTEIVYDYVVEEEAESSSVEEFSPIEKFNSTDKEFSSVEKEQYNEELQQKNDKEGQVKCIGRIHELQGDVQKKSDNDKPEKFEDLQLQMEIENIQDLDEIPLKLKIQQEQLEEKLHQQMKTFQEEFYKNSKLEYDKEQQLKGNTLSDPVYDRQQKLFYELKDKFLKTKEEYKDLVQKKTIEALQQKVDEKQLLEMKEFPEEFVEPNIEMEDLHKEVLQLQRECTELEPEFSYNIPLVVDEKPNNNETKKVEYNLYDKLFEIHRKKLRFFADSKEWPLKHLYPSSLLDELFDDPSEVNPNVFVITLYTIDIGYSIKITMNKDQPPVETFYSYAEDSILEFVEKEQLPPCLLDLLEKARPRLFYNGRVIAEIHNKIPETCEYSVMALRVARLLLHPHRLSILRDVDRIIEKCKPTYCSYERRLKIESKLLKLNFPVMCMDPSPVCGLTVKLQHDLLSRRTMCLNPLKKKKYDSSKFEMDLSKKSQDDKFPTTKLNESQQSSSNLTDTASDNRIHHLLWKFEFRIKTFKLIKLYVFVTETREYSMLLCMNSTVPFSKKMRFKINLETNKLKPYIDVILENLKKNVNPDILVVRRYKSDDKAVPHPLTCIPSLLNDNVYEPDSADIHKFLEELVEHIPKNESDEENTDETKMNNKMESEKKNIHFDSTKTLPKNLEINTDQKKKKQVQTFESKNSISRKVESKKSIPHKVESSSINRVFVDSKSLRSSTIPIDVSLGLTSLPKKSLNSVGPSLTGSKSNILLDDKSIKIVPKELNSISTKEIKSISSPLAILPTVSSHTTEVSLTPRYITIFSSAGLNKDYRLTSKYLERFKNPSVSNDIIHKPVSQTKIYHTKYLGKNMFSLTSFGNVNSQPLNNFETANQKSELSSGDDEMEKNIKVAKHIHQNSICVKGPETFVKKKDLPLLVEFSEGRSNKPNTIDYLRSTQHSDDLTTNIHSLSHIKIRYPVTKSLPSSLNKFNNQDQMNDLSFQEINCTSSSNTKDIKSNKRKRSS
ncbi:PREDICTED: uncharacterized protein LOC107169665 isoform X2 [Diuraphis noxia]|uniref:uncharacterized protein LOC107169665 isoform X2 n=1 Tax=Diuraphis noxia TaxID=143948 RepID=UPI000763631E|nr:PREDICTED: uncharacterized protein LOC107169665 isoform X2 [Diuraphis noxia]